MLPLHFRELETDVPGWSGSESVEIRVSAVDSENLVINLFWSRKAQKIWKEKNCSKLILKLPELVLIRFFKAFRIFEITRFGIDFFADFLPLLELSESASGDSCFSRFSEVSEMWVKSLLDRASRKSPVVDDWPPSESSLDLSSSAAIKIEWMTFKN